MIQESTLDFLRNLEANNNRAWFLTNKDWYENEKETFTSFCGEVLKGITVFEPSFHFTTAKDCVFRINRDIRFSADKKPYKNNFSAAFGEGGRKSGKIDYYLQVQDHETILGGGMWQPSSDNLSRFRQEIDYNPQLLKGIINDEKFRIHFPDIHGQILKTKPKGYTIDHPDIDLLKYKEMFFVKKFSNNDVLSINFVDLLIEHCIVLKPYLDFLNNIFK